MKKSPATICIRKKIMLGGYIQFICRCDRRHRKKFLNRLILSPTGHMCPNPSDSSSIWPASRCLFDHTNFSKSLDVLNCCFVLIVGNFCVWVTLSNIFTHFTCKKTQRMVLKKNVWNKIKLDIMLKVSYLFKFIFLYDFFKKIWFKIVVTYILSHQWGLGLNLHLQ
jgi:hypothetical protein